MLSGGARATAKLARGRRFIEARFAKSRLAFTCRGKRRPRTRISEHTRVSPGFTADGVLAFEHHRNRAEQGETVDRVPFQKGMDDPEGISTGHGMPRSTVRCLWGLRLQHDAHHGGPGRSPDTVSDGVSFARQPRVSLTDAEGFTSRRAAARRRDGARMTRSPRS